MYGVVQFLNQPGNLNPLRGKLLNLWEEIITPIPNPGDNL